MSTSDDEENVSRCPSRLLFDEEDSSSDCSNSGGPRRRCSFVSTDRPVMDLRGSYHASDQSYDLSVCSNTSLSTQQTNEALAKMGMFEIALSAGFKREDGGDALTRTSTYPDMSNPSKGLLHKVRLKRHTLDHGVGASFNGIGHDDDSVVSKKDKTPRKKAYIFRRGQAVAIVLFLSIVIASVLFFETTGIDPSSIFANFPFIVSMMEEKLFGSSSGQEVEQNHEERVMVLQPETMMTQEEMPVNNHEYDKVFVQAFRNNQKIASRLERLNYNIDPMRQVRRLNPKEQLTQDGRHVLERNNKSVAKDMEYRKLEKEIRRLVESKQQLS